MRINLHNTNISAYICPERQDKYNKMDSNVMIISQKQILSKDNFSKWILSASTERGEQDGEFKVLTDYDNCVTVILDYPVSRSTTIPVIDFDVTDRQMEMLENIINDFLEYEDENPFKRSA